MRQVTHATLGTIDSSSPGWWEGTRPHAGRSVTVDLTIDGHDVSPSALLDLLKRAEDLEVLDSVARVALRQDAEVGDDDAATVLYVQHHRDELSDAEITRVFGAIDRNQLDAEAFLSRLVLERVGLYPESDDSQILLDYTIGREATDYLLSVAFDSTGTVTAVNLES